MKTSIIKKELSVIIALIVSLPIISLGNIPAPTFNPQIDIKKINNDIKIDGKLSDSEWQLASIISNFIERDPGDNIAPQVNTETYITYDEKNLYIGFKCYDDPALVRASMTQRDQYVGDDEVGVYIDTYGDASIAYEFFVNPFGIQKDRLWNPVSGGDIGFDLIWSSSAEITDYGYEVEIAIPFSSLRFPNKDVQSWKIDFRRNHPRDSYHQYSWAAYNRNEQCSPCQWGTVSGISSVRPGKGIEILPAFVSSQKGELTGSSDYKEYKNYDPDGELAISGKYALSSDVTMEGSINPDFSQIESDAAQIDVNSTFSLFFPERRPFFQEGADIFRTLFNSFYTRTIFDPKYAVKMTGRPGSFRFGLVSAIDDSSAYVIPLDEYDITFKASKSYVNILRGLKSIGRNSRIGFLINDRRYEHDGSNTVLAVDGDISLSSSFRADGQLIYTYTKETENDFFGPDKFYFDDSAHTVNFDGESFGGIALISRIRHFSRHVFVQVGYNQIAPSYRTETGYDPINNHRTADSYAQYTFFPQNGIFERITPNFSTFQRWNFLTGQKRNENVQISLNTRLRVAQTNVNISFNDRYRLYNNVSYNLNGINFNLNSQPSQMIGLYTSGSIGDGIATFANLPSNETYLEAGLNIKPSDRVFIEPDVSYLKGSDVDTDANLYQQYNIRTRINLQVNRKLSLRLVTQYVNRKMYETTNESFDVDPLVTYRINPFTVFYVGSTNSYSDYLPSDEEKFQLNQRKFFLKLQYLFQT